MFIQQFEMLPNAQPLEKAILYRLERALTIESKLQEIEDKKTKETEKTF